MTVKYNGPQDDHGRTTKIFDQKFCPYCRRVQPVEKGTFRCAVCHTVRI